ncbi:hypothetical protein P3T37_003377 [Kitasatospora sp. MAA4]|uniref:zf-HC2 domain-containing protein n=1 Tax=Kitasatospora sp. MAA4 TaxID=3035093 RepID=UPI00247729BA|nr:zf-HC2 domain-containing protein [Kitasatospora sp. MAA4]MDH6133978.1 hypothetical protein [Kitasatospora sp. MAA4]
MTELEHEALRGLLGAWALRACPTDEAAELERHFDACPDCAEEGARLRHAAGRLAPDDPLDRPDGLRQQVLDFCLSRRAPELPLAPWVGPYAAETAKLDALLRDLGRSEWQETVELPWHGGVLRRNPAEVVCHLAAVDGLLAATLGLPDPVEPSATEILARVPAQARSSYEPWGHLVERSDRLADSRAGLSPDTVRTLWRQQSLAVIRTVQPDSAGLVRYGPGAELPVRDAFVDRAFECWIHGEDVARAVDYPYAGPAPQHLRQMVDLAARMLPTVLAGLRTAAYAGTAGRPRPAARLLKLVIEGPAAGEWLIPLDAERHPEPEPDAEPVAELVMDGIEFCQLAAAHRDPDRLPVGEYGDRAAIREVLTAVPLLSRP